MELITMANRFLISEIILLRKKVLLELAGLV